MLVKGAQDGGFYVWSKSAHSYLLWRPHQKGHIGFQQKIQAVYPFHNQSWEACLICIKRSMYHEPYSSEKIWMTPRLFGFVIDIVQSLTSFKWIWTLSKYADSRCQIHRNPGVFINECFVTHCRVLNALLFYRCYFVSNHICNSTHNV